jgi:hypothetical protein
MRTKTAGIKTKCAKLIAKTKQYMTILMKKHRLCTALLKAEFFHRTPAGHTAERKTRRKRNRGYYELLSIPSQPSAPPSPPPPHRASVAPPAATLSGLAEGRLLPPPPQPPPPPWLNLSSFQRPRPKARMASI